MRLPWLTFVVATLCGAGCSGNGPSKPIEDTALANLDIEDVGPAIILPRTILVIEGSSFVSDNWGESSVRLVGTIETEDTERSLDRLFPAHYRDDDHLELRVGDSMFDTLGGDGARFSGTASVEVYSYVDGELHLTEPIDVEFDIRETLDPNMTITTPEGLIYPNDPIVLEGTGVLFSREGDTIATVEGCFRIEAETECRPVAPQQVTVQGAPDGLTRDKASFAFAPYLAGIQPGEFTGSVTLQNIHRSGEVRVGESIMVRYTLGPPQFSGVATEAASLAQYITFTGAGFVGGSGDTRLEINANFRNSANGTLTGLNAILVPEFVDGHTIRYTLNEEDDLGRLGLRNNHGTLDVQQLTIVTHFGDQTVRSAPYRFTIELLPIRQVVYINFLPSYTESLRHFGLRPADHLIRKRVFEVVERDYEGINLELRDELPQDFALFSQVDIAGPDPNGKGLFGYDNSPGKDVGNERLYDRIGGVNAITLVEQDGLGYGGVFLDSFFGYSAAPNGLSLAREIEPLFDRIFDRVRPDRGGRPVSEAELETLPDVQGFQCPGSDRATQVACAIWVLGNLIGSTVSHEIGHSLGLAKPAGSPDQYHNGPDEAANRLMDGDRPFAERAELDGQGPSRFCVCDYLYLRDILPTDEDEDIDGRPSCGGDDEDDYDISGSNECG